MMFNDLQILAWFYCFYFYCILLFDCLELIARTRAGSGVFCGQLQTVTDDIFIFAVLDCVQRIRGLLRECAI